MTLKLSGTSANMLGASIPCSNVIFSISKLKFQSELAKSFELDQPYWEKITLVYPQLQNSILELKTVLENLQFLFVKNVGLEGAAVLESQIKVDSSRTCLKPVDIGDDSPDGLLVLSAEEIVVVHEELKDSITCKKLISEPKLIGLLAPLIYSELRTKTCPIGAQLLLPSPESLYADLVLKYNLSFEHFEILDCLTGIRLVLTDLKQDSKSGKEQSKSRFEFQQLRILENIRNSLAEVELAKSSVGKSPKPGFCTPKQNVAKMTVTATETKWHSKVSFKSIVETSEFKKSRLSRLNSGSALTSSYASPKTVNDKPVYQSTLLSEPEAPPAEMEDMSSVKYVVSLSHLFIHPSVTSAGNVRTLSALKQIRELLIEFSSVVEFNIAKLVCLSKLPPDLNRRNLGNSSLPSSAVQELLIAESPKDMDDSDDSDSFEDISNPETGKKELTADQDGGLLDYLIETFLNCSIAIETIGSQKRAIWRSKSYFSMVLPDVPDGKFFEGFHSRVRRGQLLGSSSEAEQLFHDYDLLKNPIMIQIDSDQYMTAYSWSLSPQDDSLQMIDSYLMLSGLILKMDNSNPLLDSLSILDAFALNQVGITDVHLQNCYMDYFDPGHDTKPKNSDNTKDQDSFFSRKLLYLEKCSESFGTSDTFTTEVSSNVPQIHAALLNPEKSLEALGHPTDNPSKSDRHTAKTNDGTEDPTARSLHVTNAKLYLLLWDYSRYRFKWAFPKMNLLNPASNKPQQWETAFEPFKFGFSEVVSLSGVKCFSKFFDPRKLVVGSRVLLIQQVSLSGTMNTLQACVEFLFPNPPLLTWDSLLTDREANFFRECKPEWQPDLFARFRDTKAQLDREQDFIPLRTSVFEDHYMHLDNSYCKSKVCFSSMKIKLVLGEDFIACNEAVLSSNIHNMIEEALTSKPQVKDITIGSLYVQTTTGANNLLGAKPKAEESMEFDRTAMIPVMKMFENKRSDSFMEFTAEKFELEEITFLQSKEGKPVKSTSHELSGLKLFLRHGSASNLQPFLESHQLVVKSVKGKLNSQPATAANNDFLEIPHLCLDVRCGEVVYVSAVNTELSNFLQRVLMPSKDNDPHLCLVLIMQILFGSPSVCTNMGEVQHMQVRLALEPFCLKLNNEAGGTNKTTITVTVPGIEQDKEHTVKESLFDLYKNVLSTAISNNNQHLGIETKFKDYPRLLNPWQKMRRGVKLIQQGLNRSDVGSTSVLGRLKGFFSG